MGCFAALLSLILINSVTGLHDVADIIIGNEERRGISGGQKKRVNVGMELVAEPRILFLDEPTTGLDSVSAVKVEGVG